MADLLDRQLGSDWPEADAEHWQRLDEASDEELWAIRRIGRERLVAYARRRTRQALMARGMREAETAWCDWILDPATLTIGFARRFAQYKRGTLLLRDRDRLKALLTSKKRPVQLVFAGKSHPADDLGKALLREVVELSMDPEWRDRVVFLDDYDIGVARLLLRGADVWLNTPLRLMEACGTSGMKAALNGSLNCSVLDGWWDEMFDGDVGWAISSADWIEDAEARDDMEAAGLMTLLETQVVPTFYDRGAHGIPTGWLSRMKAAVARLGPQLSATRMLRDYVEDWYLPASRRSQRLAENEFCGAREMVGWRARIVEAWPRVCIGTITHEARVTVGTLQRIWVEVALGGLGPNEVEVQLWHGRLDADDQLHEPMCTRMVHESSRRSSRDRQRFVARIDCEEQGSFGLTVRVVPSHPELHEFGALPYAHSAPPKVSRVE
jgi:starch phosphorylase